MVFDEPARAHPAGSLLIRGGDENEIALELSLFPDQFRERDGLRRGRVQHVDRSPAPDITAPYLAAEGARGPVLFVHRDHIKVAHVGERGRIRVFTLHTDD